MHRIDLNKEWLINKKGSNEKYVASVPCSIVKALLDNKKIVHPYYGMNENEVLKVFEDDYVFTKEFEIEEKVLNYKVINLVFECIDTIADVFLNDNLLLKTSSMHYPQIVDVKNNLVVGKNVIKVHIHSPKKYIEEHSIPLGKPFNVIRKAACMFGWDWGINLPDSGIYKDAYIECYNNSKITDINVIQKHSNNFVKIDINIKSNILNNDNLKVTLLDEEGKIVDSRELILKENMSIDIDIDSPKLWWPRGYGKQSLYKLIVNTSEEHIVKNIGLRTIKLDRSKDKQNKGHKYQFIVNNVPVYYKGSNMIIDDAIIPNTTNERIKELVLNAVSSNHNGIRIWGGSYYPSDYFYDLCDEYGVLVYQDLMFACTFYYPSKSIINNIKQEVIYQLNRLKNHPSIAIINGNNEIDCIYTTMTSKEERTIALRRLFKVENGFDFKTALFIRYIYSKIFLKLIPSLVKKYTKNISYVHGSPSVTKPLGAKSMFDYLYDGDMHYYLQYDGNISYKYTQTDEFKSRFISEMGFQSYPSYKTLENVMDKKDLTPYSDTMYAHQKCFKGNETIEEYMKRDYIVPDNFSDYVYLSQLQSGEILSYSIEHMRRHNNYNRGMIIWQLNDCWPVVSWSSVDYYGRWKAQQYYIKRFYSDILYSLEFKDNTIDLYITSDGREYKGAPFYKIYSDDSIIENNNDQIEVEYNSSRKVHSINLPKSIDKSNSYLVYGLSENNYRVFLFTEANNYNFAKQDIETSYKEDNENYYISIKSNNMIKSLAIDFNNFDAILSDNYFDIIKEYPRTVTIAKDKTNIKTLEDLKNNIIFKSLNNILCK